MRTPVPYTYVVASMRRRTAARWSLSIHLPNGMVETLTNYRRRQAAIDAARLLAFGSGNVEVRP